MCIIYVARKHFFLSQLDAAEAILLNTTQRTKGVHKHKWRSLLKSKTHIFNARPRELHFFHPWSSFNVDTKLFIRFYRLNFLL